MLARDRLWPRHSKSLPAVSRLAPAAPQPPMPPDPGKPDDHEVFVQHALCDVVVIRARVHWNVRLDRDWFAESPICRFRGMVMAFPSPRVQLHPALLPGGERAFERGIQRVRKLRGICSEHLAFRNLRIPNVMEIRNVGVISEVRIPREVFYRNTISATVAVGRAVQRLVQVAHNMNDKSQRRGTLRPGRVLIFQNGELIRKCLCHAATRTTKSLCRALRRAQWDINKVPRRGGRISATLIVGPGGRIHEGVQPPLSAIPFQLRIDGICRQQRKQRLLRLGREVLLRQGRHGFMTAATPPFRCWCAREKKQAQRETQTHQRALHLSLPTRSASARWGARTRYDRKSLAA